MELLLQNSYSQQHDLEKLHRALENRSSSSCSNNVGETILKILAVIAGIFLVLVALATFRPGVALLAIIVVGAGCGTTIYKANAIMIYFRTWRPAGWFTSNRRVNVYSSTGGNVPIGGGYNRRGVSSSTTYVPQKGRNQQRSSQSSYGGNVPIGGGLSNRSPGNTFKTPTQQKTTSNNTYTTIPRQDKPKNVGIGSGRGRE